MFFRSKITQKKLEKVEQISSSSPSLSEMSELLKQAAGVVEGIQARCDTAEQERDAARADLALIKMIAAKQDASLREKDELFSEALENAANMKIELKALRMDSAEFEIIAYERIDMLQAELEDLEKTATQRWGSLELRTPVEPNADDAILDLIQFPDGTPLRERRAA